MTPLPEDEMLSYIEDNLLILLVDEKYVVGLDVVQPWFSSDEILTEEFVFKYGEGPATMQDVVDGMMSVARQLGCTRTQVGTLAGNTELRHKALASIYRELGFTTSAVALTKDT